MRKHLGLTLLASLAAASCAEDATSVSRRPFAEATSRPGRAQAFVVAVCPACVFGPRLYTRGAGAPFVERSTILGDPAADYIIDIDDGGSQGADGSVMLNGEVVLAPRTSGDVRPRHVRRAVALRQQNVLEARLTGRPGSTLTISILGGAKELGATGGAVTAPGGVATVTFSPRSFESATVVEVVDIDRGTGGPFGDDAVMYELEQQSRHVLSVSYIGTEPPLAPPTVSLPIPSDIQSRLRPGVAATLYVRVFTGGGEARFRYIPFQATLGALGQLLTTVPIAAFLADESDARRLAARMIVGTVALPNLTPPSLLLSPDAGRLAATVLPGCAAAPPSRNILAPLTVSRPTAPSPATGFVQRTGSFHAAHDIAAADDTPVYAAENGIAYWKYDSDDASAKTGYGRYVVLSHEDGGKTLYAHLASLAPALNTALPVTRQSTGGRVSLKKGEIIGLSGHSGNAGPPNGPLNPQLHLEYTPAALPPGNIFAVDPVPCQQYPNITIAPSAVTLAVGGAAQLNASTLDQSGAAINGLPFTWTSSGSSAAVAPTTPQGSTAIVAGVSVGVASVSVFGAGAMSTARVTTTATASSPTKLVFLSQPQSGTTTGPYMFLLPAIQVAVTDQYGNVVPGSTDNVTISIGNNPTPGAVLGGTRTVAAVAGIATFATLTVSMAGTGYTLEVTDSTTPSVSAATSSAFSIAAVGTLYSYTTGLGSPNGFVSLSGATLASGGALLTVPSGGGTPIRLATPSGMGGVVNDGRSIYWIEGFGTASSGAIKKIPVGGGTITTLASGIVAIWPSLQSDGTNLYFVSYTANGSFRAIRRIGLTGGPITDLFLGGFSNDLTFTIHGGFVYLYDGFSGLIKRVSTAGGVVTTMTTGVTFADDLVVAGGALYWTNGGRTNGYPGGIYRVATSAVSTAPTTLVGSGSSSLGSALATDGTSLYVATLSGLFRYDLANFASVTKLGPAALSTRTIALDAQSVYWTDLGTVLKTRK